MGWGGAAEGTPLASSGGRMSGLAPMEMRKDILGEKFFASRNYNNLEHTYKVPGGANRAQLDWNLTLRQVRSKKTRLSGTQSLPNLNEGREKNREPLAAAHPDGPYHCESETLGKYQNRANTDHMLTRMVRVSSGSAHGIDWQLNLRDGLHAAECNSTSKWKRHFARPQVSFDMMKENCSSDNAEFHKTLTTPQDRRPDRSNSAIPIVMIRDDPISFKRWPGAEGTEVGQWRHLIEDRSGGYKVRRHLEHETTLRQYPGDSNGARIADNRSHGCIVEMLGKKKWVGHESHEPMARPRFIGDPKLYHLSRHRILPEADEEDRARRMSRQQRTDDHVTEVREPISQRKRGARPGDDN